jgi:hypothetical protein
MAHSNLQNSRNSKVFETIICISSLLSRFLVEKLDYFAAEDKTSLKLKLRKQSD